MTIYIFPAITILIINGIIFAIHYSIKKRIHENKNKTSKIILGDIILGDLLSATALSIFFITIPTVIEVIKGNKKDNLIKIFTLFKQDEAPFYMFFFLLVIFIVLLVLSLIYKEKDDALYKTYVNKKFNIRNIINRFKENKNKHLSNLIGIISISLIFLIISNYIIQLFKIFKLWISTF